ncbi:cytidylyltransferase domain-containing protein [Dethiothermospora halolimnae]|uniref:cytidylyltransferase domain-containing protein n=1 Tax=Dethiothermospora halolimnae TaxID=3114390 RepID=UPI003CCBB4BE
MKNIAIIQARMGSTRLPGKVMMNLCGKTILAHVINRVKQSKLIDEIIVATTCKEKDDAIKDESKKNGVKVFRGSENDVLSRYYYASKENGGDTIIRITSDCPLIDPYLIDEMLDFYIKNDYDMVTNATKDLSLRTYPRGLDTEIFSFENLKDAFNNANKLNEREHVTPYLYKNSERTYYYRNNTDYSNHRWTLDTIDDFKLIKEIYEKLYDGHHDFYFKDILKLFKQYPKLMNINSHIKQKNI